MNRQDSELALVFKTHPVPGEPLEALFRLAPLLDQYASQPRLAERFLDRLPHAVAAGHAK